MSTHHHHGHGHGGDGPTWYNTLLFILGWLLIVIFIAVLIGLKTHRIH